MKLNQKGAFDLTLVAALVIVVAVGGFVLMRITEDSNDTALTGSSEVVADDEDEEKESEASEISEEQEEATVRSASWKSVTSGQGGLTANIPDGWKVINVLDSNWITVRTAENTVFTDGTPAEVEEFESFGTDGPSRVNIISFDDDNFSYLDGDEENLGDFEAANVTGTKYYKQYSDKPGEGIGPLPNQQTYTYMFEVGKTTAFVKYNIQEGEEDILEIVEEMITTLSIR